MNKVLVRTLLLVGLGTAALESWRPLFYLTDDNLTGYLPLATDWCRQLWHGRWPFTANDPSTFVLFSPWLFLFSWVALTPFWFTLVDIVCLCNSLAIAAAFCWSALWLRRELKLEAPDWLIVLLALSYTFSPYNLIIGASWLGFFNAEASFSLILVGFFHPSARKAVALQAAALVYALFGGHAHSFIVLCLFSGVAAIILSVGQRHARPVLRLLLAGALAGALMLPVLLPAFRGFAASPRARGIPVLFASVSSLDLASLGVSYLLGPLSRLFKDGLGMHGSDPVYNLSIAFSLANLLLVWTLARVRRAGPLVAALAVCFCAAALLVVRPGWLGNAIEAVPVLNSLQWPFRELWVMHFAAHTFGVVAYRSVARPARQIAPVALASLLFAGVFFNRPPTFSRFDLDRWLIVTGKAERYWAALESELPAPLRVIVGIWPAHGFGAREKVPFTLLGTFNFGSLFNYEPRQGYTFTVAPRREEAGRPRPNDFSGAYNPPQARLLAQADPTTVYVELLRVNPPEWSVSARGRVRRYRYLPEPAEIVPLTDWTTSGTR